MEIAFHHQQSAHCETGVIANLLTYHGLQMTEPMAFGIGSGLFFGYFPFIRLNKLPLTAFRISTGGIMNRVVRRLGVDMKWEKFRDAAKAMRALDEKLEAQIPVGCRTGAYWLSYFPERYRFHFNMHNLVVFGKKDNDYLISDPVFPEPVVCPAQDLTKARFAKGPMPPKGKMYHIHRIPEHVDLPKAIGKGIREVCRTMLRAPGPFFGVRGMHYLAKKMETWPEKLGEKMAVRYLGQMLRMQEEIGTGGAGFRFMYAAFLQECAQVLGDDQFYRFSNRMTAIGDTWREFAVMASRICKARADESETYPALANLLRRCAREEKQLFLDLMSHMK